LELLISEIHFRESKNYKIFASEILLCSGFYASNSVSLKTILSFEFIELGNSVLKYFILCPVDLYRNVNLPSEGCYLLECDALPSDGIY